MIHLSKPLECMTPSRNLNVDYGLRVIIVYQRRFTDCNRCTRSVEGDIDDGGGCECVETGFL